jgi:hypothetical protein
MAPARTPFIIDEVIASYKRLIGKLPLANQYLLLYVLDLLTVFAKKADINKMNAASEHQFFIYYRDGLLAERSFTQIWQ